MGLYSGWAHFSMITLALSLGANPMLKQYKYMHKEWKRKKGKRISTNNISYSNTTTKYESYTHVKVVFRLSPCKYTGNRGASEGHEYLQIKLRKYTNHTSYVSKSLLGYKHVKIVFRLVNV